MFTTVECEGSGGASSPGQDGGSPVDDDAVVAAVGAAVDVLVADDAAAMGFAGQLSRLKAVGRLVDRLEAERVRLVGIADRSGALADDGAATVAAWLRRNSSLTAGQAKVRGKVADRLRQLPVIAAAFAAGELGVSHVSQIDRLAADVGVEQVAAVQAELVTAAGQLRDVGEFTRLCTGWRHALRPDLADAADDHAYANRRLSCSPTFDGVVHLSGAFDAESGATIAAALDAFTRHDPPGTPPELRRSAEQRRADALHGIAEVALAARDAAPRAGGRAHVVVRVNFENLISHPAHPDHHRLPGDHHHCAHAAGRDGDAAADRGASRDRDSEGRAHTHDGHDGAHDRGARARGGNGGRCGGTGPAVVDWAGPVGPATLERLLSDATVTRIITNGAGQPLDMGTATRVWPAAMRRAIVDRDRGCRFDPCDRPAGWCDIDHVVPVSENGPTAVTNGILLCRHHHRAKRRTGWWPTLHPDGTVTWVHADGRTRTDVPPAVLDRHMAALHSAAAETGATAAFAYPVAGHTRGERGDTAGETRGTYRADRAPPDAAHPSTFRSRCPSGTAGRCTV